MKFDEETVKKYIVGEDIEGYTLEELENDTSFMIAVLKQSKDIKMEQFASDSVKKHPKFVIEALKLCGKDISKMLSVAKPYLESVSPEVKETLIYKEIVLYIDMFSLFDEELGTTNLKDLPKDLVPMKKLVENEAGLIDDKEYDKIKDVKENKFKAISENNNNSDIIMESFARWFIIDYFHYLEDEELSVEEILSKQGIDLSIISSGEVPMFIINYIKTKDESLSVYLLKHMTFLNKTMLEVNSAIKRVKEKRLSMDGTYLKALCKTDDFEIKKDGSSPHNYGDVDSESTYKHYN